MVVTHTTAETLHTRRFIAPHLAKQPHRRDMQLESDNANAFNYAQPNLTQHKSSQHQRSQLASHPVQSRSTDLFGVPHPIHVPHGSLLQ